MQLTQLILAILLGSLPVDGIPNDYQRGNRTWPASGRQQTKIDDGWRFRRFEENPDGLNYDILKPWIMPAANNFIKDSSKRVKRPNDNGPSNITYAEASFKDDEWEELDLPHDWAIEGLFYEGEDSLVSGGMGRLPSHGVGWYRRTISFEAEDEGR